MAVDMNPEPGRIVLGKAGVTDFYPWFKKAGVITKVSGSRVYYTDPETGNERFLHTFSAVVDKETEEAELLRFTEEGIRRTDELIRSLDSEKSQLLKKLNHSTGQEAVATVRRPRSRRPNVTL